MRLRTILTMSVGATVGAGAMYLFDPEHGSERRREVRRSALRSARSGAARTLIDLRGRVEEMVFAAAVGYQEVRAVETAQDPAHRATATLDSTSARRVSDASLRPAR